MVQAISDQPDARAEVRKVTQRCLLFTSRSVDFDEAVTKRSEALHGAGVARNPLVDVDHLDPDLSAEGARFKRRCFWSAPALRVEFTI